MKSALQLASIRFAAVGTAAGFPSGNKSTWPLVLCMGLLAANSFAATITFTHSGAGSGSVGNLTFSNAAFTITGVGDTSFRIPLFSGETQYGYSIDHSAASIFIVGVGSFQFTSGSRTFVNRNRAMVGFSRAGPSGYDLFNGPTASAFASWDMLGSISPVSGTGYLEQWEETLGLVSTDGGPLFFESAVTSAMFQASVVPEPSVLALAGFGAATLMMARWRKRVKANSRRLSNVSCFDV